MIINEELLALKEKYEESLKRLEEYLLKETLTEIEHLAYEIKVGYALACNSALLKYIKLHIKD